MHRAHRLREGFDMVEVLAGIGAQLVEREAAVGPRLIEGMLEHRALCDLAVDCRRNRPNHARLPVTDGRAIMARGRVGKAATPARARPACRRAAAGARRGRCRRRSTWVRPGPRDSAIPGALAWGLARSAR